MSDLRRKRRLAAVRKAKLATHHEESLNQMQELKKEFQHNLAEFAAKYGQKVQRSASMRQQFFKMCADLKVDPLATSNSVFGRLLGTFYYRLGIQIVDVCVATRPNNGGLIPVPELLKHVRARYTLMSNPPQIEADDVEKAIAKLGDLASEYKLQRIGSTLYVLSVPTDLSADHSALLSHLSSLSPSPPCASVMEMSRALGWAPERVVHSVDALEQLCMLIVDEQTGGEPEYWATALLDVEE
ncbi:ELL-associated protein [Kipferlia bialata]|uniref:ELL-associated protein n=1 Tax=Kipferlia bialata TaxID=797122 RepID=A0A9K3GL67_9EUKA|nr:ELL-associated protein [Kipferlia bialata]|eukprot:g8916.t1